MARSLNRCLTILRCAVTATLVVMTTASRADDPCATARETERLLCEGPSADPAMCASMKAMNASIASECAGKEGSSESSSDNFVKRGRERLERQHQDLEARERRLDEAREQRYQQQRQQQQSNPSYQHQLPAIQSYQQPTASAPQQYADPAQTSGEPINNRGEKCLSVEVRGHQEGNNGTIYKARFANSCATSIDVRFMYVGAAAGWGRITVRPGQVYSDYAGCYEMHGCTGRVKAGATWSK